MRVTTVFNKLLALQGAFVQRVEFTADGIVVGVRKMNKTAVKTLMRIAWATVGNIIERVVARKLDPDRLQRLYVIGIDEVSYRKGHEYPTAVADHATGNPVWIGEGRSRLPCVSAEGGAAISKLKNNEEQCGCETEGRYRIHTIQCLYSVGRTPKNRSL